MIEYIVSKSSQTGIWQLSVIGSIIAKPVAFSGSPNGGNVQALVNLIPKSEPFHIEVISQ